MPINLAESLKKRIGPIPAWGWGVGIGGAVLVVLFLRGSSLLGGKSTDTSKTSDATDTSTTTTQSDGSSQKSNGSNDTSSSYDDTSLSDRIAALEQAAKDAAAKKKNAQYDENTGKMNTPDVPWGSVPQGSEITTGDDGMPKISSGASQPTAVTSDKGATGGSQMAASSNGSPTISLHDIGGVQIASPDTTPKPTVSTVRSNPIPMTPAAAGKAATNMSRQVGRPYHDSNTGNVSGL